MQVMRVPESDGHGCVARELPLDADHRVIKGWCNEIRTHLLAHLGRVCLLERRNRREGREKARICNCELLLPDAIVPKRRHRISQRKTVIKDSEARTRDGLWREGPRHADPR